MIKINIDSYLKEKGINQKDLAKELGITEVSLSRKVNGNVSITLNEIGKICDLLDCRPDDIIVYKDTSKKILPIFMNYNGVGDIILKDEKYTKIFFDLVKDLENVTDSIVKIIMVSCFDIENCKKFFIEFESKAEEYDMKNLFHSFIGEYCGFIIEKEVYEKNISIDNLKITTLKPISSNLVFKRNEIENICKKYNLVLNNETYSYINIKYNEIDDSNINKFVNELKELFNNSDIEVFSYNDKYSRDCDIKDNMHNEGNAINMYLDILTKNYNIHELVICESLYDTNLYSFNIDKIKSLNIRTIHIKQDSDFDINMFLKKIINNRRN